jgi:hypothetical protein
MANGQYRWIGAGFPGERVPGLKMRLKVGLKPGLESQPSGAPALVVLHYSPGDAEKPQPVLRRIGDRVLPAERDHEDFRDQVGRRI